MGTQRIVQGVALIAVVSAACAAAAMGDRRWSDEDVETIRSLWIGNREPVPADPSNRWATDLRAAELGKALFSETRLSSNGAVACATCHDPEKGFQDGRALAKGVGTTNRRAMPIAGTARSPFLFWDGRKDSQWAQALGPLESPVEHGGTRAQYAHVIAERYRSQYEGLFGPLPDLKAVPRVAAPVADTSAHRAWERMDAHERDEVTKVYVNIGKSIAAYERTIEQHPARFDRYAEAVARGGRAPKDVLTHEEENGLAIFIGKGRCVNCHNGPLFTNNEFHNTGVPAVQGLPEDRGRFEGATKVLADEFNCRSRWSDAQPGQCPELEFLITGGPEQERAFQVPSLRDVAGRAPYMDAGQIATLEGVVAHYAKALAAPAGHSELHPLRLSESERADLVAFLKTRSAEAGR
jgi:cytochrome c peroxidase